jgi:hypothetical protein
VVAADGSVHVAFVDTADLATGRDQYLVVKLEPTTGQRKRNDSVRSKPTPRAVARGERLSFAHP